MEKEGEEKEEEMEEHRLKTTLQESTSRHAEDGKERSTRHGFSGSLHFQFSDAPTQDHQFGRKAL
ncbi:hypothetical protein E2C01_079381 [Portunus trituberculatus]|uniref:Uncharacterized protein n=1 Tax=Portunus trituberculatus TaxID=210409 RepID=A0A5B7ISL9_PORTR|nr:hypothetical protein [Portunus trituberculatus]